MHRDWKRILVVRPDNIGDLVMLGPALRALRAAAPRARVVLLTSPAGSQVAPMLPWIDEVIVERVVWQDVDGSLPLDPAREARLVERLARYGFDAAFIFTSFTQSPWPPGYLCYLAGIPVRAGQSKEFGGSVLTHWVRAVADATHQVDRNLALLESLGISADGTHLELRIPESADAIATGMLAGMGVREDDPFVVMAPVASCPARTYPLERAAELAARLAAEGLPIVLLGHERDRDRLSFLFREVPVRSLVGATSVPVMAAIIRHASLLVGNDSGPMHIADAVGTPMVITFSGTDLEEQWRPRRAESRLLRRETDCSPCYSFECRYAMQCLDIPAEEVATEVLALLRLEPQAQLPRPAGAAGSR